MRKIKGYLDEWRIQEYLLITFFISWLSWGILILLTALNVIEFLSVLGVMLFLLGGFGPTISAIMCIDGKISFKRIWKFITEHRKGTIGYALLFAIMLIGVFVLDRIAQGGHPITYLGVALVDSPKILANIILSLALGFIVVALIGGGNEELGWRGTLQPLMEKVIGNKIKSKTLNFVITTIVVGLIWALWHLPLWFVVGSAQQGTNYGLFVVSCVLISFWLGCIYHKTRSVLYCMLFRAIVDIMLNVLLYPSWIMYLSFAVMAVVAIILVGCGKEGKDANTTKRLTDDADD